MSDLTPGDPIKGPERSTLPLTTIVVFCGCLMTLSGFSTDVMLPAFTAMVDDLDTSLDLVQGTISSFALFFGIGQFIYGPASDKYGRRPIIAAGMTIFLIGSVLATFGSNIETVLVGRAIQGFGAGAAPVLARAILRDTHEGTALARAMAISMVIFAFGPIFAPLLGYGVVQSFGWRSTFALTGILAAGLLLFNIFHYRETNMKPDSQALKLRTLWASSRTFFGHRQSLHFLLCGSAAYCALFSYISNAPRIYTTTFNATNFEFAVLFALTGFGIILGQSLNRRFLPKLGILNILRIASLILVTTSATIGVLASMNAITITSFTALMFFFNTSFLVIISNTAALCLNPHPGLAGFASAAYGFVTNIVGAAFITVTVSWVGQGLMNWALAMTAVTTLTAMGILVVRKDRLSF